MLQVHVAQPLVVPNLPVVDADAQRLLVHIERGLVSRQQVQRATHLLQVRDVVRVEACCRLEELQRLVDLAALALDERLDIDWVLSHAATVLELLLNGLEALVIPANMRRAEFCREKRRAGKKKGAHSCRVYCM